MWLSRTCALRTSSCWELRFCLVTTSLKLTVPCKVRPLLVGKERKPPFPDTCGNPGWNVSEKMQKKFLKYISLRPQYIPYARRVSGRGLARLATSGKCFSPTLGKSLSVLLPDSWKEFKRKCKMLSQKKNRNHRKTWRAACNEGKGARAPLAAQLGRKRAVVCGGGARQREATLPRISP